jgi:hypothetical protein
VGGAGPSFLSPASAQDNGSRPVAASASTVSTGSVAASAFVGPQNTVVADVISKPVLSKDAEHIAQRPLPKPKPRVIVTAGGGDPGTGARRAAIVASGGSCPSNVGGAAGSAPSKVSPLGVHGTTSADLAQFARTFNAIRVANCLQPIPMSHFRYDSCMEQRLFWMAEDPSTDPSSAWGHIGSVRSDGKPSVGCDGNLAGGSGNTGATVASKWWNSPPHRASLYRPTYSGGFGGVCINFAMTHGGVPNEAYSFTRAAARWVGC